MKEKYFLLVECNSTSVNYLNDVIRRGCRPLVLHTKLNEEMEKLRAASIKKYPKGVIIIKAKNTYEETLKLVKSYNPIGATIGTEALIDFGTRLIEDLKLPGNPYKYIDLYTKKDAMHDALKKAGIRYIKGINVHSAKEAVEAYREFKGKQVVLKPPRGAAAQCVYFCKNEQEVKQRAIEFFNSSNVFGDKNKVLLIQERIIGDEYVVNCMTRNGVHRVLSVWKYQLIQTLEGRYVFGNLESVNELEIGSTNLINYTYKMLDALKYYNGPSHNEFLIDENGPVLLELNARIMGGPIPANFADAIFGHHDTDQVIEDLLFPNNFEERSLALYRTYKKGICKFIVVPKDITTKSLPIVNIAKKLRSFYDISFSVNDRLNLAKTVDFETAGGIVYLLHDKHNVVLEDNDFLHMLETLYFNILFEDKKIINNKDSDKENIVNAQNIIKLYENYAPTLVLNDDPKLKGDFVKISTLANIEKQPDLFEIGILNLVKEYKNVSRDIYFDKILTFLSKIRPGGIVCVSKATTNVFPYGTKGMELLLKIAGFKLSTSPMYFNFMVAYKETK